MGPPGHLPSEAQQGTTARPAVCSPKSRARGAVFVLLRVDDLGDPSVMEITGRQGCWSQLGT